MRFAVIGFQMLVLAGLINATVINRGRAGGDELIH